jgi:hypothetical protein
MALPWTAGISSWFLGVVAGWHEAGKVFVASWIVAVAATVGAVALLHKAGIPVVHRGLGWPIDDVRVTRAIHEDIVWSLRPHRG